ncbi:MAG: hypothetical protein DRJ49_06475 [Thermoprotei archaeon]|nr:MAG: hypothetical protein DRJ49_06475 [Thermoprotei archaeon]
MKYRKLIPLVNIILFTIFIVYTYLYMLPRYRYTSYYTIVHMLMALSTIGIGIAVLISIILYWFRVGEYEENV